MILPYPLMLPEAPAARLQTYVERGGTLVAEARLGWSNEHGYASERIPGMGLWEVMGCRETGVQVAGRERINLRWTSQEIPGIKDAVLPGRWYQETLEPLGASAQVAARFADGSAGAVLSRFGKGKTLLLGSYVSAAYETSPSPAAERFFVALLRWAGVVLPAESVAPDIEVRTLEAGPDTLVFAFNHDQQAAEARIGLRMPAGVYKAADLVSDQAVETARDGEFLRLGKRLHAGDVWVVRITRQ